MSVERDFLSRWSRRKSEHREGRPEREKGQGDETVGEEVASEPDAVPAVSPQAVVPAAGGATVPAAASEGVRTDDVPQELPPVESLTPESDFKPFMGQNVDPATRGAALKRLFSDPRYNEIDGLDVYLEDYNKADPIPPAMLRMLDQARSLGLFDDEAEDGSKAPTSAPDSPSAAAAPPADQLAGAPDADRTGDNEPTGRASPPAQDGH